MDSGSDTGISAKSNGLMSLGLQNTIIHTCIRTKNQVLEEVKVSLLDAGGYIQNVRTQASDKPIGPEILKPRIWYDTAFDI